MKGFGARERNGLITFACIIAILLGIGPVADRLGCTRRGPASSPAIAADTALADTALADGADNDQAAGASSDGEKKSRKKKKSKSKKDKGRKKSGGANERKSAPPAERRNYLDEGV